MAALTVSRRSRGSCTLADGRPDTRMSQSCPRRHTDTGRRRPGAGGVAESRSMLSIVGRGVHLSAFHRVGPRRGAATGAWGLRTRHGLWSVVDRRRRTLSDPTPVRRREAVTSCLPAERPRLADASPKPAGAFEGPTTRDHRGVGSRVGSEAEMEAGTSRSANPTRRTGGGACVGWDGACWRPL